MIDEGTLRARYPEMPWDQPVALSVFNEWGSEPPVLEFFACRYCIAMHGVKAQDIIHGRTPESVFTTRDDCLVHIESAHHD
jgi:hypothetical protein